MNCKLIVELKMNYSALNSMESLSSHGCVTVKALLKCAWVALNCLQKLCQESGHCRNNIKMRHSLSIIGAVIAFQIPTATFLIML